MNNVYSKGYKIALGRRVNKSWKQGFISNASFLTFTYVNTLSNKFRTQMGANITVSGSGFYVCNDLIKQWGGWPFHSLTEDYELTKWAVLNDVSGYYCECATIKDEQPTTMRQSRSQRLRWIKGHNIIDNRYNNEILKQALMLKTKNRFFKFDYLLFPSYSN